MPWKMIDPQPVTATINGGPLVVTASRWEDFNGAIVVTAPSGELTILAGEYTPVNEAEFEQACAGGTRI